MKKALYLVSLITLISTTTVFGQNGYEIDKNSDWRERVFTGGNLGLQLGSNTYVNVSPVVGYRITNELSGGLGVSYVYRRFSVGSVSTSRTDYGGSAFARYNLFQGFFAMTQYEYLSFELSETVRQGFSSVLAGGGISEPLGNNAALSFTVLYNLSYRTGEPSPYNSPWVIGGGVTLGF